MDALTLLLASLAVYRLATDLAWMDGPFGLYMKLRGAVMARAGADSWLTEGIGCPVCWSFWLAMPAAALIAPDLATGVLEWLGIAGAVALVVRVTSE